jgi:RNA polymerase-associated protein RTF1
VTKILAEKREKQGSRHNLLFEKEQVKTAIAHAEAAGDFDKVAELTERQNELQRSITERLNPKGTMEALANINKRNELQNSEKLAKRASEQVARLKKGFTNTGEGDPFSRRPTRLTNYWDMGEKQDDVKIDDEEGATATATTSTAAKDEEDEEDDIFLTAGVDAKQSAKELAEVLQQRHKECASKMVLDLNKIDVKAADTKSTLSLLARGAVMFKSAYDAQRAETTGVRPQGNKVFTLDEYIAMSNMA